MCTEPLWEGTIASVCFKIIKFESRSYFRRRRNRRPYSVHFAWLLRTGCALDDETLLASATGRSQRASKVFVETRARIVPPSCRIAPDNCGYPQMSFDTHTHARTRTGNWQKLERCAREQRRIPSLTHSTAARTFTSRSSDANNAIIRAL